MKGGAVDPWTAILAATICSKVLIELPHGQGGLSIYATSRHWILVVVNGTSEAWPILSSLDSRSLTTSACSHGVDIEGNHGRGGDEEDDIFSSLQGKEKEEQGAWAPDESMTAAGAADIRDSFKRTADSADLDEGGKDAHRLEKARRAGECVGPNHRDRV